MINLFELKQSYKASLDAAEAALGPDDGHTPTQAETDQYHKHMNRAAEIKNQIEAHERRNTIRGMFSNGVPVGVSGVSAPRVAPATPQVTMSAEYTDSFISFLKSNGKNTPSALAEGYDPLFGGFALPSLPGISAAVYEGSQGSSNAAGGYAVNVPTDSLIVPLAVPDLGVRGASRVIPTATDIKVPRQGTFATAGWKLESGTSSNAFSESAGALEQFTLSAYMTGLKTTCSWELLQDVQTFQEFVVMDLLNAVDINEDAAFVSGSGTNQPLGLIGNTGTGTGAAYAAESTGGYLLNALDDILGTLKGSYYRNAAFLLSRTTFAAIVKAQRQANLFAPVVTRENGQFMIHGYPAVFSQNMPSLPTATTAGVVPILFGSFKDGYIIGDRGGTGTFVKILDQPLAVDGQTILLAYKRVDGNVRRSEAIQAITISHS